MPLIEPGDDLIEPWTDTVPYHGRRFLLLGATGSGKSTFIEALAGSGQRLGISGSTLESVTQDVQTFRLLNLRPVYLVDTPGFSDVKMSEIQILNKIHEWQATNGYIHCVFYFVRITDKRIGRSARRLIKIIKGLGLSHHSLIIVTTMWDTIHEEEARKRADYYFAYLRDFVWEFQIKWGAQILRFENTQISAFEVLRASKPWSGLSDDLFHLRDGTSSIAPIVYEDLLDRIQNASQQRMMRIL
ncbi:hypothetical protein CVT24_002887 [Panaeolus cyanescens]|uniref:G domain-containing protein n=1 Tax=Panaeolus cyanescens TaxID=181874 RepID=A0A409YRJ5_9AGAR|nr:hypothetical protein CVT24_002887 [Panaeolus cyanescens]